MVKKASQAIPNQLLRRARLERGWTQKVVADRIGAPNDMMITRWERGTAFPSAYYIERLCQLFEQKASDLGLLPEPHPVESSPQQQWTKSRNHPRYIGVLRHSSIFLLFLSLSLFRLSCLIQRSRKSPETVTASWDESACSSR